MELSKSFPVFSWGLTVFFMAVCVYAQTGPDTPPVINNCPPRDRYEITNYKYVHVNEPALTATAGAIGSGPVTIRRETNPWSSFIAVGHSETYTYIATDRYGNKANCTFTVHARKNVSCESNPCKNGATCLTNQLEPLFSKHCLCRKYYYGQYCENFDDIPPVMVTDCPGNFTAFLPEELDGTFRVSWIEPEARDNKSAVSIQKTHEPMSNFPVGSTTVRYNFTDEGGNKASCNFSVNIYVGYTLHDKEKPVIYHCPANNVVFTLPYGQTQTVVGWQEPTAKDNSGKTPTMTRNTKPMSMFHLGRTRVEYNFTDEQGNRAMCAFDIILLAGTNQQVPIKEEKDWKIVNCPKSIIMANIPANEDSIFVTWNEPTAVSKSSQSFSKYTTHSPMTSFPMGGTQVLYQITASDGSQDECRFIIYVIQGIDEPNPPVIAGPQHPPVVTNCPREIRATLPFGTNESVVDWMEPQAYSPANKPITVSKSREPSSTFLVGTQYTIEYNFTDSDGLVSRCYFTILITNGQMEQIIPTNDYTPPKIYECPENIEATTDFADVMTTITWLEPYATDNSGVSPKINKTHRPLDKFGIGRTEVRYTFTDLSGNAAKCSFNITITGDNRPPKIVNCPQSFSLSLTTNRDHVNVFWPEPVAYDNSGRVPSVDQTFHPGDTLPVGVSHVIYTFTDQANNKAVCAFTITITGNRKLIFLLIKATVCEYTNRTYSDGTFSVVTTTFNHRTLLKVNDCSMCICYSEVWYCHELCGDRCSLIYPSDTGVCNSNAEGAPFYATPCASDDDCMTITLPGTAFVSRCCPHVCNGKGYCTKPPGSPCYDEWGNVFQDGISMMSHDGQTNCLCSNGDWHCKEVEKTECIYEGQAFDEGATRPAPDGCNTCFCGANGAWSCTEIACVSYCTLNGVTFQQGQSRPAGDGCNTCTCLANGVLSCTEIACVSYCTLNGVTFPQGQSRPAGDGCNTCTCLANGVLSCTEIACVSYCTLNGVTFPQGQSRPAGDGCNTCTCLANGVLSCTEIACVSYCTLNGVTFPQGQSRPAGDGCNTCTCLANGVLSCTEIACVSYCTFNGVTFPQGQSRPAGDGCNTCTCLANGVLSCTEIACDYLWCLHNGARYENGATITIPGCTDCKCQNARLSCGNGCYLGRKRRSTNEFIEHLRKKSQSKTHSWKDLFD